MTYEPIGSITGCRWAGCSTTFRSTERGNQDRRLHEMDHGGVFEGPNAMEDTPLGPKPWRVDLEGSDSTLIRIVAADGTEALTLMVKETNPYDEDAQQNAWEATVKIAEKITGARREPNAPRLENGLHMIRYFEARSQTIAGVVEPLSVRCPECGEGIGGACA